MSYEKVAEAAMGALDGGMCWPVEWFKEDLRLGTVFFRSKQAN